MLGCRADGFVSSGQLRLWRWLGTVGGVVVAALWFAASAGAATTATSTFTTLGQSTFTVPAGVTSVTINAIGAAGGGCTGVAGGEGASVTATVAVSPGDQLLVGVGGAGGPCSAGGAGGVGGGGAGGAGSSASPSSGGGGASLVWTSQASPSFPGGLLVVAGAGGGSANRAQGPPAVTLVPRAATGRTVEGAEPAHSRRAAPAGLRVPAHRRAFRGSFGVGGAGGHSVPSGFTTGGGGGGGGYFGGGGGGGSATIGAGAGGGGSSFVAAGASAVSGPTVTGAGSMVSITYAAPTADESTPTVDFGTQPQGTATAEQALTVTNNGSAPLVVSGVLLGGSNPGDYLVDNRCQQPVAVGSVCQIGVRFDPQATGASSADLTLLTNALTAPAPVSLSGIGGSLPTGPTGPRADRRDRADRSHRS